ncbi:hypothetical protein MTO96_018681 [Rhipicephalus appendiculatus]
MKGIVTHTKQSLSHNALRERGRSSHGSNIGRQMMPYSFGYVSNDIEGSHGHEETGDGSGRVSGRYSLSLGDGRTRTVTYVADEFGYRADVVTNEPGTESRPAADTTFTSTALSGPDAAHAADAALLGAPFRASS